ncbi:fructokinase [Neptunitalea chrysea]|uniref:Fructokinase n=1 Tax=Neptunitalea chrysea TaxID=1647581 RepID=A0A9W6B5Q6_9FLAO|nr:carbohydrate kinase [Neptunitalea chrysea]GLB52110.1 fructokinase [Neptunitalea chrysea]
MIQNTNNKHVYCFGEVLWDIFPEGKKAGGAPFNVAYNLKQMGINSHMISRVGFDTLGNELLNKVKGWGIPETEIQIDNSKPTGTVIATIDNQNEAHYDIVEQVAWDFIECRDNYKEKLQTATAFIFGSLITRHQTSYNTLLALIEIAPYKVFDINIRMPYFDFNKVNELLKKSNVVKMNKAELKTIINLLDKTYYNEKDSVQFIHEHYSLDEVIITKGSKGALYMNNKDYYSVSALPVTIADTVGSGDAFLAGFISKKITGGTPLEAVKQGIDLGAFITSNHGACPDYTMEDFNNFLKTTTQRFSL